MEVVVYRELVLLVALLVAILALSRVPHLSQNMNHTSFPGENHKLNNFYHHVLLTGKMYSTYFLPW